MYEGKNELAPFYDLICTAIYPTLKKDFAFTIGDRTDFFKIGRNQFSLLEAELEIKSGAFRNRMNMVISKLLQNKDSVAEVIEAQFPEVKIVRRISETIDRRIKSLRQQGTDV